MTALTCATQSASVESVRLLLDAGADPNGPTTTRMVVPDNRADVGIGRPWRPLLSSVKDGDLAKTTLLLDRGARIDEPGDDWDNAPAGPSASSAFIATLTPLSLAAKAQNLDLVKLLIARGANVSPYCDRGPALTKSFRDPANYPLDALDLEFSTGFCRKE